MKARRYLPNYFAVIVITLVMAMVASSCSLRKNTAASRRYQAFITKYNIYYNGITHYDLTLEEMENKYEDDYSQLLYMHPTEARANEKAPQPTGDFTRSIEKGQKAIQLRSIKKRPQRKGGKLTPEQKAWYKRDEYNPFLHNAWLLMARSQYFNGDFAGAASTFFYISRHFTWLPEVVTESLLWQARSYIAMDWLFEAEVIINRIKPEALTSKSLVNLYDYVKADLLIKSKDFNAALPHLLKASESAKGAQKTRLRFLLGQVYAHLGRKDEAYAAFGKAGSSISASYRTKFNARIKQSEVYSGSDINPEVKALRRMLRYDRNKDYKDQIYYAIGNLYLSRGDTTKAIENYVLAAENSTRSGIDKAISQVTLADLYFARHEYELAQPCYSEAVPLLPEDYPNYKTIKRRSDVLDEMSVYSQNVNLQDSLLRLSEMTPEQRMAVVEKIIEELKKKEKEEAENAAREEYLANQAAQGSQINNNAASPNSFSINTDKSWYFYNKATVNSGKTEFQRLWGSRKLEDNWRRRNKAQFDTADFDAAADEDTPTDSLALATNDKDGEKESSASDKAKDPHYPEYYLSQIPETDEQKANAHNIIQEGLYNMGIILKDKLEDFKAARSEFDRLLTDYPDNEYRLEVYYNLYLMYVREGREDLAEEYRQLILNEFADSPYGLALKDPNYIDNLRNMDAFQQRLYESTYEDYLNNRNDRVHAAYDQMMEKYPLSKIMPKFMFLHALAYVTENKSDEFNAVLRELLERYPDTDITPIASAWLKGMAQGRELQKGSGENMRGMIWDLRLSNDSTSTAQGEANFQLKLDEKQLLVMTFATDEVSTNALLYEIARHNFKSFVVKDFDLEQLNFGRLGLIVIRSFDNMEELNHYRGVMAASDEFKLPRGVRPVVISDANFSILISQGRSFDEYFRFLQEQNYVDTQADLLTPQEVETLDEADQSVGIEEPTEPSDIGIDKDGELIAAPEAKPEAATPAPANPAPTTPAPTTPAPIAKPSAAPVIVPTPQRNIPAFAPGSEGDDPLFE